MKLQSIIVPVLIGVSVFGCATPVRYTNTPFAIYDKDSKYAIDLRDD